MGQLEDKIEDLESENQCLKDAVDDLMGENERLRGENKELSKNLKYIKEGGELIEN